MSMIAPITLNRWSGALWEPNIINPAISIRISPTPVPISHSQFDVRVATSCVIALEPLGAVPVRPAAFSAARRGPMKEARPAQAAAATQRLGITRDKAAPFARVRVAISPYKLALVLSSARL
jgi:hypothetical protein